MTPKYTFDGSVLPTAIVEHDQWICWLEKERDGKPTKVPITPGSGEFASSTDEQTWTTFDDALDYAQAGNADGVGFVFTADDPFVGVDLDDCRVRETGTVDESAQDIINRLDSYTERSPSQTGFHVLVRGELPEGRNRNGKIEMYDSARFFTVTGDHIAETPSTIATRQDALTAVHREYVQDDVQDDTVEQTRSVDESATDNGGETDQAPTPDIDLDDRELLAKAKHATNGEKFERLWNGKTRGYESQSEADMALCFLLAFWTGGDATQMDRLFKQSGLMREKWEEVHYADGSTYGEKTIERAIARTTEFYDPDAANTREAEGDARHDGTSSMGQREQSYLTEKNRLLRDRVNELEATLAQKNDRIDTLEATIRDLQETLSERKSEDERLGGQDDKSGDADVYDSDKRPLWGRAKRFIANDEE
ncbi:hypothetical protein [Haloarcula marina]|uniref:phage NrS-1 polymerase family protein n=1 Tax=Haloarcula marina TaxID=2961574 RepID=UPI0020B87E7C|nr:hypothetical protein [Halomicroarcula marina]